MYEIILYCTYISTISYVYIRAKRSGTEIKMSESITRKMKRFNYLLGEIDDAYHDAALKFGLSDSAMIVLYAVCGNGGSCPIDDTCRLSGVRKQTVNSALRKLEAEGVVYLEAINEKRKRICLAENGKVLTDRTVTRLITIENDIFDDTGRSRLYVRNRRRSAYCNDDGDGKI